LLNFQVTTPKLDLTGAETSARVIDSMLTSTRAKAKAACTSETPYIN